MLVWSMVWSAAVIYKKINEGRLLWEQVRGLKVKNDSLEDILEAQKIVTDELKKAEASYITKKYYKENIPENMQRLENSISILSWLIAKGAEIEPNIDSPEEVWNLFPDFKKIDSIESKIKKLTWWGK